MKNCYSNQNGAVLYVSENSKIQIEDSKIENYVAKYGSVFYFQENYRDFSNIKNTTFVGNYGFLFLIDISHTYLMVENSVVCNNSNNIFSLVFSKLELLNNTIMNTLCSNDRVGCIIIAIEKSFISLKYNTFYNITNKKEEGNIWIEDSSAHINFTHMKNLGTFKTKGDCISSYNSSLVIVESKFENFYSNCIWSFESSLFVQNSTFENSLGFDLEINPINFGVIYCSSCKFLQIFNSNFINNTFAKFGSALYLISEGHLMSEEVKIVNSFFIDNRAFESGTLYIRNQNMSIEGCLFENNIAQNGGGIILFNNNGICCFFSFYFINLKIKNIDKIEMIIKIIRNNFINNSAAIEGGAIKWTKIMPLFTTNIFFNNSAVYGKNIAAFPCRIALLVYDKNNNTIYSSQNNSNGLLLMNISTGKDIPYVLEFQILDLYNEIVSLDSS